jgi:glutamate/tyrosine decarboxylase-like PLP-dependent enzyme
MNTLLNQDRVEIIDLLSEVVKVAEAFYKKQNDLPPSLLLNEDLPEQNLPDSGMGAKAVLKEFEIKHAPHMANSAGPRYFGFVTGGSTPASVAGDWLVSVYDQVMSGSNDSVAHAIERQTISFLKDLFNLDKNFTGTFVTGATMSNFVSLATARQWVGEQYNINVSEEGNREIPFRVLSASPHSSIFKSLSMLGLGRNSLIKIETLPDREAIDINQLEGYLKTQTGPVIVVANAGTVNSVDFDDLEAIADLKTKYNFFLHVDAAFGGFAAASPKYKHLMNGIQYADTVTIDAHKWLNVPYDSAMQFTRHKQLQVKVFQNNASYLGDPALLPDSMHITPENSRRFRALPAWFSLKAYGRKGYQDIIEQNCAAAFHLGELIMKSFEFKLLAPVKMNVVCFTLKNPVTLEEIRSFLAQVREDGRVFFTPTVYKGTPAIRAAISNWQTSEKDTALGFKVLKEVYAKFVEKHSEEKFSIHP